MNNTWWIRPEDLDERQKAIIDLPITKSHLITGPPGSGKTNLLLLRASQLVRSQKPNVLVLVFTRVLREFVATGGPQYAFATEKIQTLKGWAIRFLRDFGVKPALMDKIEEERVALLKQINEVIASQNLGSVYDAIILDEAQDYLAEELQVFFRLGKVVFAAADSRQKIYVTEKMGSPDIRSPFGSNIYNLKHHYRNGEQICRVADGLGSGWNDYEQLEPTSNYDEKRYPSVVIENPSCPLDQQVEAVVRNVSRQLRAYPDDYIAVLCPTKPVLKKVWGLISASAIGRKSLLQSAEDGYEAFSPDRPVCVCSIHGSKGLEFRAVHIVDSDNLKKSSLNRNIAYMAVTRAKTSLTIYFNKLLPGYFDSALSKVRPAVKPASLNDLFSKP